MNVKKISLYQIRAYVTKGKYTKQKKIYNTKSRTIYEIYKTNTVENY